jgi:hypothetical protein
MDCSKNLERTLALIQFVLSNRWGGPAQVTRYHLQGAESLGI